MVATPEVTVLDLVGRPEYGGGLSNVATVIAELLQDDKLDRVELARVATGYPTSVAQRTGWMVETAAAESSRSKNAPRLTTPRPVRSSARPSAGSSTSPDLRSANLSLVNPHPKRGVGRVRGREAGRRCSCAATRRPQGW